MKEIIKKKDFFKNLSFVLACLILILIGIIAGIYLNQNENYNIHHNISENVSNNESRDLVGVSLNKMDSNIVTLKTNLGNIEIELFLNKSPITAGNFKKLVEQGFFDGTKFHRVIKNFMIQGGDPLSKNDSLVKRWGTGGPGYTIKDECIKGLSNIRGTIAMANSGPNTGGSQFFINTKDNIYLDCDKQPFTSKHPVFGKVISGMDVVDKISSVKTISDSNRPVENIVIEKAYLK